MGDFWDDAENVAETGLQWVAAEEFGWLGSAAVMKVWDAELHVIIDMLRLLGGKR